MSFHANTAGISQLQPKTARQITDAAFALTAPDFYTAAYPAIEGAYGRVRSLAARLIGVTEAHIGLGSSTSELISASVAALGLVAGDVVAVPGAAFSSVVALALALEARGVRVVNIGDEHGRIGPEDLASVTGNLRLVVVEWVNWWSGYRNDVDALARWTSKRSIPILVDAAQGLGACVVDFDLGMVDFLAAAGHKWLRGPEGAALLYVNEERLTRSTPPYVGYRTLAAGATGDAPPVLAEDARRFEVGTLASLAFVGLEHALATACAEGTCRAALGLESIQERTRAVLREVGGVVIATPELTAQRAGILSFRIAGVDSGDVVRRLESQAGIRAKQRRGHVRLSPAHDIDIDAYISALSHALRRIVP
jgi:cysteine desulfurase / selenocysteine lyase